MLEAVARVQQRPGWQKALFVCAGYAIAMALAAAATAIHAGISDAGDASAGMAAFSDAIFFVAALIVLAVPTTLAAIFLARPHPVAWRVIGAVAVTSAASAAVAAAIFMATGRASFSNALAAWSAAAILRLTMTPPAALIEAIAAVLAPTRSSRATLLLCALVEIVSACVAGFDLIMRMHR